MTEITKPDFTYQWSSGGTLVTPSNVKIQTGWTAEVPPYQWENWSQNRQDNAIVHLFQKGISVWSATQDYYLTASGPRAFVQGSDGRVYEAVQTNTNQNPTTDTTNTYWKLAFRDQSGSALYAVDTGTANTYKADFTPVVKTLVDGMVLRIKIVNANTTASTFTPANGVITAAAIVGGNHSALQGGEFIAGSDVWLQWNTTVGGGSWVVLAVSGGGLQVAPATKSQHAVQFAQISGVVGLTRNLKMSVTAASASATTTADEIVVETSLGGLRYCLASFSKTINLATTGAGGMDTGTAPVSGFVGIYAIYNPTSGVSALLSVNATAAAVPEIYGGANMPAGYTASALLSVYPTTASSQLAVGYATDRRVNNPAAGIFSTTTQQATLVSAALGSSLPRNASSIRVTFNISSSTSGAVIGGSVASSSTGTGQMFVGGVAPSGSNGVLTPMPDLPIITPQTLFYTATATAGTMNLVLSVAGYTF